MRKCFFAIIGVLCLISDTVPVQAQESEYVLVFSDEFNQKSGSRPDPRYWSCSPRGTSTWNRWISDSKSVAFIKNGKLVCKAIRNKENPADTAQMLTGAVETQGKFSFQYGKIEVRAKTKRHSGNFPAIWLLPEPPADPNPIGGEIDIWETFGERNEVYHTLHTNWTYHLKHKSPPNQFHVSRNVEKWHIYGVEWTEDCITWTIDGKTTGIYKKSADKEALRNKQWPFDKPFYVILNQSLMTSSHWAGGPDLDFTYETVFDWVRVYQRK